MTLRITEAFDLALIGILFIVNMGLIVFCLIWFKQNFDTLNPKRIHVKIDILANRDIDILKDKDLLLVSMMIGFLISGLVLGSIFGFGFIYNMICGIKECI